MICTSIEDLLISQLFEFSIKFSIRKSTFYAQPQNFVWGLEYRNRGLGKSYKLFIVVMLLPEKSLLCMCFFVLPFGLWTTGGKRICSIVPRIWVSEKINKQHQLLTRLIYSTFRRGFFCSNDAELVLKQNLLFRLVRVTYYI